MYPSLNLRSFVNSPNHLYTDCFIANEGTQISFTSGRIHVSNPELRIYDNPVEKSVISLMTQQGIYSDNDDLSRLRCFVENNSIYIRDPDKNVHFLVNWNTQNPDNSKVFVNLGGEIGWAAYRSLQERNYLENLELKRKYHHLIADRRLYLCDPVTFKPLFRSHLDQSNHFIEAIPEAGGQEPLIVSKMFKAPFDEFEDRSFITYWSKGTQLEVINFSRLNITLKRKIESGKEQWIYAQDPNWSLANEQFIPFFGQSAGFLVLQNNQGQKKVLFPVWNPDKNINSALNFPYHYAFDAQNSKEGRVVECDLVGAKLIPKTDEARFYLARIYLEKGMVEESEILLFPFEAELNHKAYSKEAEAQLLRLCSSPMSANIHAHDLRIRMHALYLYEKNRSQFPKNSRTMREERKKETLYLKRELIKSYLERKNELLPLPEHEELLVLKNILPDSPRIKELESKSDLEPGIIHPFQESIQTLFLENFKPEGNNQPLHSNLFAGYSTDVSN